MRRTVGEVGGNRETSLTIFTNNYILENEIHITTMSQFLFELADGRKTMRRRLKICILLTLILSLVCAQASAVSFLYYGTGIPFYNSNHETTGVVYGPNEALTHNLWVGTVEAPGLGKAFLYSLTPVTGGLALYGSAEYRKYTGDLTIEPSPACSLPEGTWSVHFEDGVPYLNKNGMYEPKMIGVTVYETTFSIPVRDQYGNPVVGAVFELEGTTWGGNDILDAETIVSDKNGMLTFPYPVIADRSYWFSQVSAPEGYEMMEEELIKVEISTSGGFRAMTNSVYPNETYVDAVINRTTKAPSSGQTSGSGGNTGNTGNTASSASASTPPRTGDTTRLVPLFILLGVSALVIAVLVWKRRKRS